MSKLITTYKCIGLLLLTGCLISFYGCKKGGSNPPAATNSTVILGKWLMTKEETKVYSASGSLLKDTIDAFDGKLVGDNWFQIFNKNGASVTLLNADTSEIATYTISGNIVTTYPSDNHGEYELQNIVLLNGTNLELEAIEITSNLPSLWGLDPTGTYKLVDDQYFTRQ